MHVALAEQFKRIFESRGADDLERLDRDEDDIADLLDEDLGTDEDENLFDDVDDED